MEGLDEYGLRSASVPLREQVGTKREPLKSTISPAEGDVTVGPLPSSSPPDPANIPIPASLSSRTSSGNPHYSADTSTAMRPIARTRSQFSRGGSGLGSTAGESGHRSRHAYGSRSSAAAAAAAAQVDDDEPLLFTMSELEAQARRSSVEDITALVERGERGGMGGRRW